MFEKDLNKDEKLNELAKKYMNKKRKFIYLFILSLIKILELIIWLSPFIIASFYIIFLWVITYIPMWFLEKIFNLSEIHTEFLRAHITGYILFIICHFILYKKRGGMNHDTKNSGRIDSRNTK